MELPDKTMESIRLDTINMNNDTNNMNNDTNNIVNTTDDDGLTEEQWLALENWETYIAYRNAAAEAADWIDEDDAWNPRADEDDARADEEDARADVRDNPLRVIMPFAFTKTLCHGCGRCRVCVMSPCVCDNECQKCELPFYDYTGRQRSCVCDNECQKCELPFYDYTGRQRSCKCCYGPPRQQALFEPPSCRSCWNWF
jgi:hypothetical protein